MLVLQPPLDKPSLGLVAVARPQASRDSPSLPVGNVPQIPREAPSRTLDGQPTRRFQEQRIEHVLRREKVLYLRSESGARTEHEHDDLARPARVCRKHRAFELDPRLQDQAARIATFDRDLLVHHDRVEQGVREADGTLRVLPHVGPNPLGVAVAVDAQNRLHPDRDLAGDEGGQRRQPGRGGIL